MKKFLALFLCAALWTSMIATAFAQSKTVLTVATWDAGTTASLAELKAAYEASHPDVEIQYVDIASQNYSEKITVMLAGGEATDIIDLKSLSQFNSLVAQGYLMPLDEFAAASQPDFSPYVGMDQNYINADGHRYAMPYRSDFYVLFYNKSLFDKAGVAYPSSDMTLEQYRELAKSVTSADAFGAHFHTWPWCVIDWTVCDGKNTLIDGDYSDLIPFYQLYFDMLKDGSVMEYSEVTSANLHYSGAFAGQKIAMLPMGSWYISTLIKTIAKGDANFEWGIVNVPHAQGVKAGTSFGSVTGSAINVNSKNKELAFEYLKWRCGEEASVIMAKTGTRPAYVSDATAKAFASIPGFPADEQSLATLSPVKVYIDLPAIKQTSEIETIINEEHSAIMVGEQTIEEGVANMNERIAELFK